LNGVCPKRGGSKSLPSRSANPVEKNTKIEEKGWLYHRGHLLGKDRILKSNDQGYLKSARNNPLLKGGERYGRRKMG